MSDHLSLEQLVHLSLGDPEVGAVNFNVLKTVLLEMLKAMNLFNFKPLISDDDQRTLDEALSNSGEPEKVFQRRQIDRSSDRLNVLEEKVFRFESQINALKKSPSNSELIGRAKQQTRKSFDANEHFQPTSKEQNQGPILELWQYTQLEKRIESSENGITRLASLLQDLLIDLNEVKRSNESLRETIDKLKDEQQQLKTSFDQLNQDWARKSDLNVFDEKLKNLQNLLSSLEGKLSGLAKPAAEPKEIDVSRFLTIEQFEEEIDRIRKMLERLPTSPERPIVQLVERQSQTSAKRKETVETETKNNSNEFLDEISTLKDRYDKLRSMIDELEKKKLDRNEMHRFDDRLQTTPHFEQPLIDQTVLTQIAEQTNTSLNDLSEFQQALHRLQQEFERFRQIVQDLMKTSNLNAEQIENLNKLIQHLEEIKADRSFVDKELEQKADKRDLDHRVLKKDFQTTCHELSQNINDCLQKFHVHDDAQRKDFDEVHSHVKEKLDRQELNMFRDSIDKQLKKLKKIAKEQQTQQQHVHVMSEDEAAGLRKQLIRFHCISCDRPIDVQPHPQLPSLPVNQGMRPIQSPRPYTTFELDQIRQYQKSQQFSSDFGGGIGDVYSTIRQCGGSHTMTLPSKRLLRTQATIPEENILIKNEVDIKGNDGVIYKGRIDADKLPVLDMHKKNTVVLLAPPPPPPAPPRSRLDAPLTNIHHFNSRDNPHGQHERVELSPVIPSLEPNLPREESYT